MSVSEYRLIGRGIYSLSDAARLTGVPTRRIYRWTMGYEYSRAGLLKQSTPVIQTDVPQLVGTTALSFADLLEVRLLHAFREKGVSWHAIRIASEQARTLLGLTHPFSSRRFSTDGHTILAQFVTKTGDEVLLDLVRSQYAIQDVLSEYLFGHIEFNHTDVPTRWFPHGESTRIVIDPERALGAPIVTAEGVPTMILTKAYEAEESIEVVAEWYDVDPESVAEAVEFEYARFAA